MACGLGPVVCRACRRFVEGFCGELVLNWGDPTIDPKIRSSGLKREPPKECPETPFDLDIRWGPFRSAGAPGGGGTRIADAYKPLTVPSQDNFEACN